MGLIGLKELLDRISKHDEEFLKNRGGIEENI